MEMVWALAAGVIIGGVVLWILFVGVRFCTAGNVPLFCVGAFILLVGLIAAAWIIDAKVLGHQWGYP